MSSGDCAQLLPRSSTAQQRPRDGLHRAQEMRLLPPRGCSSQYYHTALSCSDRTWDREYLYSVMNWATGRVGVRRAYSDSGPRADAVSDAGDNPTLRFTYSGPYSLYNSDERQNDSVPTDKNCQMSSSLHSCQTRTTGLK